MVIEQYSSEDVKELAKTMLRVQQELKPVQKDRKNTYTNSMYATLSSVMEACSSILIKNGIWLTQYPVPVEIGHLGLVTKLMHAESGQWQSSLLMMPLSKNDPQGYGSAITYARRYALSSMVGIITENDDDAEGACIRNNKNHSGQNPQKQNNSPQSPKPPSCPPSDPVSTVNKVPSTPQNPQNQPASIGSLPRLDGIFYNTVHAEDGRAYITATGDTMPKKDILKEAGFRWNAERKFWWKHSEQSAA